MDNSTTIISQNIINVDIDSRAVTLPVNFNLGVMYDNSCKTITFMVQKKSDITDLTDLTFSVNTISAKGTPDKIECDCREEGGFYIITAVLKGTIFEASGKAVFNLCGQKFDSSHVAIKSWGSEDITALVGSHFHAEKAIEELYPSVLEELRQKVNNPNLTDEQLNSIATKVAEKGFYTKSEVDGLIANIAVPTRLSQLADDTTHRLVTDVEKAHWNNKSDFDGSYNSLTNKPTIPNRLSQLAEDDSHMTVTKAQRDKIDTFTSGSCGGTLLHDGFNEVVSYTLIEDTSFIQDVELGGVFNEVLISFENLYATENVHGFGVDVSFNGDDVAMTSTNFRMGSFLQNSSYPSSGFVHIIHIGSGKNYAFFNGANSHLNYSGSGIFCKTFKSVKQKNGIEKVSFALEAYGTHTMNTGAKISFYKR